MSNQNPEQNDCPLCKKNTNDLLKHLRIDHDIDDSEKFNQEMEKIGKRKAKQMEFAKYVEEMQVLKRNGTISDEEYRRLMVEWDNQHKT